MMLFLHIPFNLCRVRTSSGTFLPRGRDKIVQRIEKRIADFTFIPVGMHFNGYLRQHLCIRIKYLLNFICGSSHQITIDTVTDYIGSVMILLCLPCSCIIWAG